MLERIAEARIIEAMKAGEFEDLERRGQCIDLRTYFETPGELRTGYALMKQAGFVPREVEILKEIEVKNAAAQAADDAHRPELRREIERLRLRLNVARELQAGAKRASRR